MERHAPSVTRVSLGLEANGSSGDATDAPTARHDSVPKTELEHRLTLSSMTKLEVNLSHASLAVGLAALRLAQQARSCSRPTLLAMYGIRHHLLFYSALTTADFHSATY